MAFLRCGTNPLTCPAAKPRRVATAQARTAIRPAAQSPQPVKVHTQQIIHRQGPLPDPQELAAYNDLLPDAANRIIAMAEREQAARHNADDMAQRADIRHRDEVIAAQREHTRGILRSDMAGQIFGASIAMVAVIGAVLSVCLGAHPTVSIALVGLPIASIIKAIRAKSNKSG